MQHRSYFVDEVSASGMAFPAVGGKLLVVRRPESPSLDWELVVQTKRHHRVDQAPYDLSITGPDGTFNGSAILVRSDGHSHVFRGAGDLDGFTDADFRS